MHQTKFVSEDGLDRLLACIEADEVYATVLRDRGLEFSRLGESAEGRVSLREARPSSSPKAFLQPVRERVAVYTAEGPDAEASRPPRESRALVGLRACDLVAIAYLDKVFREGDFTDPFYAARREGELIVSVDCAAAHESCFCTAVGGQPYAESGFDLNLTPIEGGYLVEAGSDRGQAMLDALGAGAADATTEQLARRDAVRRQTAEAVDAQTGGLRVSEAVQAALLAKQDSDDLSDMAIDCVECAACTFICPTCHCFFLYDQVGGDTFERIRTWDSCILGDYHRMAGPKGAKPSPKPSLRSRCANRLLHKYAFSPQQYGMLGCTGCGRCIEACYGGIDIRDVLREIQA